MRGWKTVRDKRGLDEEKNLQTAHTHTHISRRHVFYARAHRNIASATDAHTSRDAAEEAAFLVPALVLILSPGPVPVGQGVPRRVHVPTGQHLHVLSDVRVQAASIFPGSNLLSAPCTSAQPLQRWHGNLPDADQPLPKGHDSPVELLEAPFLAVAVPASIGWP